MKLPKTGLIPNHYPDTALARILPVTKSQTPSASFDGKTLTMRSLTKLFLPGLLSGSLIACSTAAKPESPTGPEIFRVGEVEVRLYQDRDRMVRSLPPLFALLEATRVGNRQIQVSGYFDPKTNTIYAIDDARTVIHEFKHYLEPHWKHGHGPERSERPAQMSN